MKPMWHGSCEHGCRGAQIVLFIAIVTVLFSVALLLRGGLADLANAGVIVLLIASLFIFLTTTPWRPFEETQRCVNCRSRWTDAWHRRTEPAVNLLSESSPWALMASSAMYVVHCRRCGHETETPSFHWSII